MMAEFRVRSNNGRAAEFGMHAAASIIIRYPNEIRITDNAFKAPLDDADREPIY